MNLGDPRTVLIAAIVLLPAAGAVNAVIHGRLLSQFVRDTPAIRTYQDLLDFERMVARQMYAALMQILLLALPGLLFAVGLIRKILGPGDFLYILAPAGIIMVMGIAFKGIEKRAQAIPAEDPVLEERRQHIIKTWISKPFPDW
jgi:hypothetical protein